METLEESQVMTVRNPGLSAIQFRFRRCCVQSTLKDGSAQFVFLYTLLRIFTFSFNTINVCTIYL